MKLKALLQKLFASHAAIAAALNLPSEQMVGDQKFQTAVIDAKRLPDAHAEILAALAEDEQTIANNALAEAVKAGTHIPKDAHETAVTAAKQSAQADAEKTFKAQAEAKQFADGKRAELAKLITAEAAALVPDSQLAADTHATTFAKLTARAEELKSKGITIESLPSVFTIVASQSDDALYAAYIKPVLEAHASKKVTTTASTDKKVQPTTTQQADGDKKDLSLEHLV